MHDTRPVISGPRPTTLRELFHICYWLARTYAKGAKPAGRARLSGRRSAKTTRSGHHPRRMQKLAQRFRTDGPRRTRQAEAARPRTEQARAPAGGGDHRLRDEIAAVRKANEAAPDTHDYDEAQTRDAFIDLLLHEAGWPLDQPRDREYPVTGHAEQAGEGFVDYVLWGDDGKPLALVEAKRTKRDARVGQQQAKLYADCLEKAVRAAARHLLHQRLRHWLWDDVRYPPRAVQGFLKKDELELLHQRRTAPEVLNATDVDPTIVERYYQTRAIRRIGEAFEQDISARRCW